MQITAVGHVTIEIRLDTRLKLSLVFAHGFRTPAKDGMLAGAHVRWGANLPTSHPQRWASLTLTPTHTKQPALPPPLAGVGWGGVALGRKVKSHPLPTSPCQQGEEQNTFAPRRQHKRPQSLVAAGKPAFRTPTHAALYLAPQHAGLLSSAVLFGRLRASGLPGVRDLPGFSLSSPPRSES